MNDFVRDGERELQQAALDRLRLIGEVTRYQADAIRFAVDVGIPKQRIKAGADYKLLPNWSVGGTVLYVSTLTRSGVTGLPVPE